MRRSCDVMQLLEIFSFFFDSLIVLFFKDYGRVQACTEGVVSCFF